MWHRIYAIFQARNREFLRDRAALAWNLILPVALIFGLSFAFGNDRDAYTVGILVTPEAKEAEHPFLETRYIEFVDYADLEVATDKIARHQLDLLVEFSEPPRYWVNPESPTGYFAEIALLNADAGGRSTFEKQQIGGEAVSYADWVLPGILGMNMMFSCLFGVGYVVVRYRKNGFLKRLNATPLTSFEFIAAQIGSRLILTMTITTVLFLGTHFMLGTRMEGSYFTLFLVASVGTLALVSMGLIISASATSEELAGGLLNLMTWPMMMLSGVWFSLEGASPALQNLAQIFPLTHILNAARAVMLDGATLLDVAPSLLALLAFSAVFMAIGARIFRWGPD